MATSNPEKIGRYQVVERVGRGGMGVLFRGVDPVLDREVAIKLMLVDFSEDTEQMRPRFYREARAAAKLQHRNIVTVFEFAEEGNTPYIVMEFLRGTSLAARIASPIPLTLEAKLDVVAQLCDALSYAHEQGVVHRDVKPANIFLLTDGTVKLLDFGIAKVTTSTLTRTGDLLGSASYMSPEQVAGADSLDGRSDIFSAGVVLYEMLAGRKPFHAEAPTAIIMKILHEQPPALAEVVPGLPAELVTVVNRALAKNPAERYSTAGELAKDLQWIRKAVQAAGEGAPVLEETRFATPTEVRSFQKELEKKPAAATSGTRKWLIPASIGAVVVVGAVVAAMLGRGTTSSPSEATVAGSAASAASAQPNPGTNAGSAASAPRGSDTSREATAKTPDVAAAALEQRPLQVGSDPAGASIFLDGRDTNQSTPAAIAITGAGPHRLRLVKRGFAGKEIRLSESDVHAGSVNYKLDQEAAAAVAVSIASTYPVEVWNASRSISASSDSHQLNVPTGTTIHIKAPKYFLDAALKVEGKPIDYQTPALGYLTVLTKYETCSVKVGTEDLGYPPITKLPIVSGQYRVDISCPNGQNPPGQFVTIAPNNTATARIF